ncbi:MAG: universal stress protein [Alphaproteobacteria bacterium]|nr:universal stress protein [Alphaproteobacteria bacterium]
MSPASDPARFHRILVALDATTESRELLELAADLASCFESQLTGLYVEDEDMMSFANLPIGREISSAGAGLLDLTRQQLETHFRNHAAQVRRVLEVIAGAREISHSFDVRHGRPEREIQDAAKKTDLLAIGPRLGAILRPRGEDIRRRIPDSPADALLLVSATPQPLAAGPVIVAFGGRRLDERSLDVAKRIAIKLGRKLAVGLIPYERGHPDMKQHLETLLRASEGETPAIEIFQTRDSGDFFSRLATRRPGLVVVADDILEQCDWYWGRPGFPILILRNGEHGTDD